MGAHKDIVSDVAGQVDAGGEGGEGEGRLVAVVEADAAEVLAELRLDADLQQVVLEQHAVVLTDESVTTQRVITSSLSHVICYFTH